MLLKQVEGFVATAREGNVSRAAEALFISQPALTTRIKQLERQLGVELIVRTPRGIRLTDVGSAFLPFAERALGSIDASRRCVEQLREGTAGHLRLAVTPSLSTYIVPPMLQRLRRRHPLIRVTLHTCHPDEMVELLLREDAQLGLACEVRHARLESVPLYTDELVLVLAPDHPVAARDRLRVSELAAEQVIMFRPSSFEDVTAAILQQASIASDALMELDSVDAAKRMVEHRLGIALLPRSAVEEDLRAARLVSLPIDQVGHFQRQIVALRRADAGQPIGPVAHFLDPRVVYGENNDGVGAAAVTPANPPNDTNPTTPA